MNNWTAREPSNDAIGTPESNPLAEIFSEHYSFGAPIYPIDDNPGTSPPLSGMQDEPPQEFPLAQVQPTPAALSSGNPGANEAWFAWTGVSPLQINLPSGSDIRSIYITGNFDGFPIVVASGYTVGGTMTVSPGYSKDMVPVPAGSPILTLNTNIPFTRTVYICAFGEVWNPFDTGGGGQGSLIWLVPQPPAIGSGAIYKNTSKNVQLVTVGGTSAQVSIDGASVSGGQPATYTLRPGDTLSPIFGYDVTVVTMTNLVSFYAFDSLTPDYHVADTGPAHIEGGFGSLVTSPPQYTPPHTGQSITSDGGPAIYVNDPTSFQVEGDYGWSFVGNTTLSGSWSIVFWFQDTTQYPKSANGGQVTLFLARPTATGSQIAVNGLFNNLGVGLCTSWSVAPDAQHTGAALPSTLCDGKPHMVTLQWDDSTGTFWVGFDNNSPTSFNYSGQAGFQWFAPNFMGDNNSRFICKGAMSKVAYFNTFLAQAEVQTLYVQSSEAVLPVYQFYEVLGS